MEIITLPEVAAKTNRCITWADTDYGKGLPSFQKIHQVAGLLVQALTHTNSMIMLLSLICNFRETLKMFATAITNEIMVETELHHYACIHHYHSCIWSA